MAVEFVDQLPPRVSGTVRERGTTRSRKALKANPGQWARVQKDV
jgi:hypothetical protein